MQFKSQNILDDLLFGSPLFTRLPYKTIDSDYHQGVNYVDFLPNINYEKKSSPRKCYVKPKLKASNFIVLVKKKDTKRQIRILKYYKQREKFGGIFFYKIIIFSFKYSGHCFQQNLPVPPERK